MTENKYIPPHQRQREAQQQQQQVEQENSHDRPFNSSKGFTNRGGYESKTNESQQRWGRNNDQQQNNQQNHDSRGAFTDRFYENRGGNAWRGGGGGGGGRGANRWGSHSVEDREIESMFRQKVDSGINFDKYDDIPVEVSGPNPVEPIDSFEGLNGIHQLLGSNISRARYNKPTPVQKYAIPIVMAKRDLMACAQTGSGKTAAFLFPCINRMLFDGPSYPPESAGQQMRRKAYPTTLIMAPTRELATQIYDEARMFCYKSEIRIVVVYGGADVKAQLNQLDYGCDILVATPGRLQDLMERGRISLSNVRFLVLDEADRMLDMGFEQQIREIVMQSDMPKTGKRQTMMYSATFPKSIQQLASEFLSNYLFLTVGRVGSTTDFITQKMEWVDDVSKRNFLTGLLSHKPGLTLVFVETKRDADSLEYYLQTQGLQATSIHGDRTQKEREDALRSFKSGKTPVLVATDVAARGLDIPKVAHVIQYDLPNCIDDYVHRIGRTGRAGNTGLATAFVNEKNKGIMGDLLELLRENNQEVPTWMHEAVQHANSSYSRNSGRRGGGNTGNKFGARDFRNTGRGAVSGGSSHFQKHETPQKYNQFHQYAYGNYGGNYGSHQLFQPGK